MKHWILYTLLATYGSGLAADAAFQESDFLSRTRQLILEGRRSGEGYFSPDGTALIYQAEKDPENPFYQIHILDFETGESHQVSPGNGKTTCAFFRPGTAEVLFASTHHDPKSRQYQKDELERRTQGTQDKYSWDYDPEMDIFSCQRDGTQLRRLTQARGYDAEGSYSPDGKWIAFCSNRSAYPESALNEQDRKRLELDPSYFGDIYIMKADGTGVRQLTQSRGYDGGPFFSPDGNRIIWRRFTEDGHSADIYTMKTDGTDVQRLTDFECMSWAPYYHPSGEYVIFTCNKNGFDNFELYLVDTRGKHEPVRVTETPGFDGLPVFSPDGKLLSWSSNRYAGNPGRDDKAHLYLASWNHEKALQALAASPLRKQQDNKKQSSAPTLPAQASASVSSKILESDMKTHVEVLASDVMKGRFTGTPEEKLAADYLIQRLKEAGLQPGFGKDFLRSFEYESGISVVPDQNSLKLTLSGHGELETMKLEMGKDFEPLSFTHNASVEGPIIFGGYALAMPDDRGGFIDPFGGANLTNKIVLAFHDEPEAVEKDRKLEMKRYSSAYLKALAAQRRGALGILLVVGPNSPGAGKLRGQGDWPAMGGKPFVAANISGEVAAQLMAFSGKGLKARQDELDQENPHAETGVEVGGFTAKMSTALKRTRSRGWNVAAWLPAQDGTQESEYVVVGAHYDHLGLGKSGSLAGGDDEGKIHNGADDNASGVALLLELAADLSSKRQSDPSKFERGVLFGFWSGEELGLLGSADFAEHTPMPADRCVAYVNFDMVGRLRENRLMLQGIGSSPAWRPLIQKRNVLAGFDVKLQEDPYLPTDTVSFYKIGIPVLSFFTGSHDEYHRPTDDPDTLNYEGLERIGLFAGAIVRDLIRAPQRPEYAKVQASSSSMQGRKLRVYLGTIPDYAAEVKGVKLSGVRSGGPADQAQLQGGDIIIEMDGMAIANIYDYTAAIDIAKPGKEITLKVQRGSQVLEIQITPESR